MTRIAKTTKMTTAYVTFLMNNWILKYGNLSSITSPSVYLSVFDVQHPLVPLLSTNRHINRVFACHMTTIPMAVGAGNSAWLTSMRTKKIKLILQYESRIVSVTIEHILIEDLDLHGELRRL